MSEIKRNYIQGATAELGVFQGEFAQYINLAFMDRNIYLFDTFSGFDEEELAKETIGYERDTNRAVHENTNVELVIRKMKYPEKVIVRKGLFPATAEGLDEKFAFVSLDCDWEESLYQGLKYFYPRLNHGGYIMVHDYNNSLTCAQKAISRYEAELGHLMCKVPICDAEGSIVLTK